MILFFRGFDFSCSITLFFLKKLNNVFIEEQCYKMVKRGKIMERNPIIRKNLAVGIILLFVGTCLIPTDAQVLETSSSPTFRGDWLYVGGSGPGNYTKIQDAVDNASDGDTVFVYDTSSPYKENIVINTSISLIGEDKNTTIINGTNNGHHGVNIIADNVTVLGFTIQNCGGNGTTELGSGIRISSNNNRITDNILVDNEYGITTNFLNLSIPFSPSTGHNTITDNVIIDNGEGIFILFGWNNTVRGNIISQTEMGIIVGPAVNNNISLNSISENNLGILVLDSYNTVIYRNNVSHNRLGVWTFVTSADKFLQNNFIGNNRSAISAQRLLSKIRMKIKLDIPIRRNVWKGNYWDGPRSLPYVIPGVFLKFSFQVDWHPAQVPFDI
jgi:parallel beta-helix repeat protein